MTIAFPTPNVFKLFCSLNELFAKIQEWIIITGMSSFLVMVKGCPLEATGSLCLLNVYPEQFLSLAITNEWLWIFWLLQSTALATQSKIPHTFNNSAHWKHCSSICNVDVCSPNVLKIGRMIIVVLFHWNHRGKYTTFNYFICNKIMKHIVCISDMEYWMGMWLYGVPLSPTGALKGAAVINLHRRYTIVISPSTM